MDTTRARPLPGHLVVTFTLAQLLQRLDNSGQAADPAQYRTVVQRLSDELLRVPQDDDLRLLLQAFPSAGTLYENLHYAHAGLCRQPLERSLASEKLALEVIGRARRSG